MPVRVFEETVLPHLDAAFNGMSFWAVSDLNGAELAEFTSALQSS